jgi:hypothetical protein
MQVSKHSLCCVYGSITKSYIGVSTLSEIGRLRHVMFNVYTAQAVSRRLLTAVARVRAQIRSCEDCGGQSGIGVGFLRVLQFLLPILIPPTAPHSSSYIIHHPGLVQ